MRFAPKGERAALDIFWYDGGIKPPVPEELMAENKELPEEGMMFVGDKGKILGGFRSENPQLIPEAKMRAYRTANNLPEPAPRQRGGGGRQGGDPSARNAAWITAFKGGPASYGDFPLARPDLRCSQPGLHLTAARWPETSLGFRRREDHQHPRGEQVPDT